MSYSAMFFSSELVIFHEFAGLEAKKTLGIPKMGISDYLQVLKNYK